jgi:hypothetical protein
MSPPKVCEKKEDLYEVGLREARFIKTKAIYLTANELVLKTPV